MIDLRSDTVTRPTPAMREAMLEAEVGDDVFEEDPTVRALEAEVAHLLGKEAALFVSSGTMGNQLAIAFHTRPGDEVIVPRGAHPVWYESGAGAALSGVQFVEVGSEEGRVTADEIAAAVKPRAYYAPRTSLVSLENTHNRAGGRCLPVEGPGGVAEAAEAAAREGLAMHLDGARLWNASVALGAPVSELARPFSTVSVCFSKGLGAPVGSAIAGSRAFVTESRRRRKMWGGGMRQSGMLAAAALFALRHHRDRLADDHAHAKELAATLGLPAGWVQTNIVNIDTHGVPADRIASVLRERGVAMNPSGSFRLRAVTHLDVSRDDIRRAASILQDAMREAGAGQ